MKKNFFTLQTIFNIIFTIAVILWSVNLFLGAHQIGSWGYWSWFTTSWIIVIERWVMTAYEYRIWEKIKFNNKKKLDNIVEKQEEIEKEEIENKEEIILLEKKQLNQQESLKNQNNESN